MTMRSRGEAEPQFEEFRRLFGPEWERLKARLARIERRLVDIEGRLDHLDSVRGDVEDLEDRLGPLEFEAYATAAGSDDSGSAKGLLDHVEGRFAALDLEELRARVARPEDLDVYDEQGAPDGA